MEFLKSIGEVLNSAVELVGDKSRKAAYLNRIRTVISCEEKAAEKEYLALGRYFYNNLRDKNNPVTEAHCAELDAIEERLDKALKQLEDFYAAEEAAAEAVEAEDSAEQIDLDDVAVYDSDPTAEPAEEEEKAEEDAEAKED